MIANIAKLLVRNASVARQVVVGNGGRSFSNLANGGKGATTTMMTTPFANIRMFSIFSSPAFSSSLSSSAVTSMTPAERRKVEMQEIRFRHKIEKESLRENAKVALDHQKDIKNMRLMKKQARVENLKEDLKETRKEKSELKKENAKLSKIVEKHNRPRQLSTWNVFMKLNKGEKPITVLQKEFKALTAEQKESLKKETELANLKKKQAADVKANGIKPKKKPASWINYLAQYRAKTYKVGEGNYKDIFKNASVEWKKLSQDQKNAYKSA